MTVEPENVDRSRQDVDLTLLNAAYARKPLTLWMGAAVAPLGVLLFWAFFPAWALLAWLLAIWATAAVGAIECRAFKRAAPQGALLARWRWIFTAHAAASGLAWSLGPTLLLWQSSGNASVLLVSTLFAVAVVAMISVAQIKLAMQAFIVATMLPAALSALMSARLAPGGVEMVAGGVLLLGMLLIIVAGSVSADNVRREAETQLRLQSILDDALDAVVSLDDGGRITGWNPRAQELFGWTRLEAVGYKFDDIIELRQPDDGTQTSLAALLAERIVAPKGRIETRVQHRSGASLPVEVAVTSALIGKRQSFTVFMTDISQRKDSEERLALFRRLFDASSQSVVIADAKGLGLYQNQAHAQALGYSNEEMAGEHFARALPPDTARVTLAEIQKSLLETGSWRGILPFRRKDGSEFTSRSSIGSIADAGGKIQYLFNIFTDITEILADREALKLAKEGAERANHAKSDFLSSMSHELRTPLNAILGFAQILDFDDTLNAEQKKCLTEISNGGHHLLKLINEVLDLAKIEAGQVTVELEAVRIADIVDECASLMQPLAAARQLTIHRQVPGKLRVRADRIRLKQVLLNLLSNAIKYNRAGGDIGVRVSKTAQARVRLEVTDSGIGIAQDRLKDVFQAFSPPGKGRTTVQGTGIGLSISRQLVLLMGGEVGVQSQLGSGSTFWCELPVDTSEGAQDIDDAPAVETPAAEINGQQYSVLCVDDNPINLKLIAQILAKRPNIQLLTAPTPGLGIQLALGRQPDLILLDINMPGMDGYQVLDVLKTYERTKAIPIIAVTANATPRDIAQGGTIGLADYLTKPLDVGKFLATVDFWLEKTTTEGA